MALYIHSINMSTLYVETNKVEVDLNFEAISSSNTKINNLADLYSVLNGRSIVVGGLCNPNGVKEYNAQYISITDATSSYVQYFDGTTYGRAFLRNVDSSISITDDVKIL